MVFTIAGLGLLIATAVGTLGLATYFGYVRGRTVPRTLQVLLWAVPFAPLAMLACLVVMALTVPRA